MTRESRKHTTPIRMQVPQESNTNVVGAIVSLAIISDDGSSPASATTQNTALASASADTTPCDPSAAASQLTVGLLAAVESAAVVADSTGA